MIKLSLDNVVLNWLKHNITYYNIKTALPMQLVVSILFTNVNNIDTTRNLQKQARS